MAKLTSEAWRRAALRRLAGCVAVAVVGFIVVIVGKSYVAELIGWAIVALAATLVVALAFLEVGYSEDRARAAEQRRAGGAGGSPRP